MKVIENLNEKQILQLHEMYRQEWWTSNRTIEETLKGVNGSQICIGIIDEDENLIGFARILTDYIFKALIFDVIARNDFRNRGLGKRLMSAIMNHQKLTEVKHFELYCLPEMGPFYEKFGFTASVGNIQLMRYTSG